MGVVEYWRFDPPGGRFHYTHLAGVRLVNREYRPVTNHWTDGEHFWGHSEALNLDLCWERGELRWYDPVARRYLPTFDDERAARIAAEARVRELEEQLRRNLSRSPALRPGKPLPMTRKRGGRKSLPTTCHLTPAARRSLAGITTGSPPPGRLRWRAGPA